MYDVQYLRLCCEQKLLNSISLENFDEISELVLRFDAPMLKSGLEWIRQSFDEIRRFAEWIDRNYFIVERPS